MYQTCVEHASITDQIHSKTESCLKHISCFVALRDVKRRLQTSCFIGTPYLKCESNLLELSMQDQLLIAEVYPPHLLTEEQQAGFAGRED